MTRHLMWTRSGVVWATWRLQAVPYGYGTPDMKRLVRAHHQALFQGLRGEALLMGLCAELDPVAIVEKMLIDVPINECPEWAEEVTLTLDALERIPLGTRAFWLSVPLAAGSWKNRAASAYRAADTQLRDVLAMPRQMPGEKEIAAAMRAAQDIEEIIPAAFKPSRATAAEQVWIALHSQMRGLSVDAATPVSSSQTSAGSFSAESDLVGFQMPSMIPNPWLDEGGQSDVSRNQQINPFKRKYLKVHSPSHDEASYQVMQALVAGPKSGWQVPGVEWISRIESFNIDADWAVRLTVSDSDTVKRRNKRAEESIKEQFGQQAGTSELTGGNAELGEIAETLAAYAASLNRSDKEVEVQATTIFAVGAETPELAKDKARFITDDYKRSEFLLEAPLGGQEELWWAMQPGTPSTRLVRELSQITTGREFASSVPMVLTELGDDKGAVFGENITAGRHTPILIDLQGNIQADSSGSFGCVAELGAGKSVLMKEIAGTVVDRGGRIVVIDRTESKEYALFAQSLAKEKTTIVDLMMPEYSLDPLRIFGPRVGARMVQSLFAVLLGIKPRSPQGVALSKFLGPDYVAEHDITSLGRLLQHLKGLPASEALEDLVGLMNLIAEKDFGDVLFKDELPALALSSDAIVFLTHGLALPDRSQLESKHLFDEMSMEMIFGRAMYTLLTAIAREVCFMDPSQLALFLVDEAHHVTASDEGERELRIFFRDGRKHGAAAGVASHDPADFGNEITRGLIKLRFVLRQTDKTLARRALEWLGLESSDEMVEEVTKNLSPIGANGEVDEDRRGEGIMLDARGRIGKFRKTLSARPARRKAVLSTPSKAERKLTVVQ
jgi:hypothetical protein